MTDRFIPSLDDEALQAMRANSYRDFHAKGLDYLCLHRSEALTLKAYFFAGECTESPELVVPHDHRYGFTTHVLAGGLVERRWAECDAGQGTVYQQFDYSTPLNGGDGFTWKREVRLGGWDRGVHGAGTAYMTRSDQIHTLANVQRGTAVVIQQFRDVVLGEPTRAFRRGLGHEAPSTDGLYSRMTPDQALQRIAQLHALGWPA